MNYTVEKDYPEYLIEAADEIIKLYVSRIEGQDLVDDYIKFLNEDTHPLLNHI